MIVKKRRKIRKKNCASVFYKIREESGLSQEAVSKALNCSQELISQIEEGKRTPQAWYFSSFANFFNKPRSLLFQEYRNEKNSNFSQVVS